MTCGTWRSYKAIKPVVRARFPAAFPAQGETPLPLAIGIHNDLIATFAGSILPPKMPQFSKWKVRQFLALYTGRLDYLRAVAAGGVRVGLDGQPAGEISGSHREYSTALGLVLRVEAAIASGSRVSEAIVQPVTA